MRFFPGPSVLIVDEVAYLPMQAEAAAALFQVVSRRYLKGSIILTTNRSISSWGQIFDDPMVAAAMLDRLLHRSAVLHNDGESYGMRAHQRRTHNLRDAAKPTKRDLPAPGTRTLNRGISVSNPGELRRAAS